MPLSLSVSSLASGALMAAYLILRPYGDVGESPSEMAEAFASPLWIAAHICGALALAWFAVAAVQLSGLLNGRAAHLAGGSAATGAILILPYYGAETFGLHAVGQAALDGNSEALELTGAIRDQLVASMMFGAGLFLLAIAGIASAIAWQRASTGSWTRWAAWPLGLAIAAMLPQFFLPPAGRIAFGMTYLVAAVAFAVAVERTRRLSDSRSGHYAFQSP